MLQETFRTAVAWFAVAVAGACPAVAAQPSVATGATEPQLPQELDEVLRWLPIETETVFVAQWNRELGVVLDGKTSSGAPDQNLPKDAGSVLEGFLGSIPAAPFYELNGGTYLPRLAGQKVKFAIEGSCRFRGVPKGPVAVTLYAGCHILIFERNLGKNGDSLMKSLMDDAAAIDNLAGHKIAKFQRRINDKDTEISLVTRPKPNVLLIATDRGYLLDLLERMNSAPKPLAFPKELPHWRQFPPNSRYWAIRRYDRENQTAGITGFVFTCTPNDATQIRLRQIVSESTSIETVAQSARRNFLLGEGFGIAPPVKPSVRRVPPNVVEITLHISDAQAASAFYVILYNALGHEFSI